MPVTRTSRPAGRLAAIPILATVLLLAACGQQAGVASEEHGFVPGEAAASAGTGGGDGAARDESNGGEAPQGAVPEPEGNAAPIEQRIVKTGEVSVEVADVPEAVGRVRAFTLELGGYVGGSQAGSRDDVATLTLRVPAARFDDVLARLRDLDGEVVAEATRESDVTRQIVDLEARITNLEASEATYRVLLERAERIEDILTVQSRLDGVRGEIEQLEAQLQDIEGDADLSTLSVSLLPVAEPVAETTEGWDPGAQASAALATLVGIGQGLLGVAIWIGIVWLPAMLVLGAVLLVAYRAVLEVRRRMPAPLPVRRDLEG
jgi:hypothetical protein